MEEIIIDTDFDFSNDTKCGDPDKDSMKLYIYHKLLWEKDLPNGKRMNLEIITNNYGQLLLKNNFEDDYSSDRMFPHFVGKYKNKFNGWLNDIENNEIKYIVRTIGGHIIFPAHMKNGKTINQIRGWDFRICDRFDLTLECIKLFYSNKPSPLFEVFMRYKHFFDLFMNFRNYVEYFLLQDLMDNKGNINFALPFDNFNRSALPESKEEYKLYKNNIIELINKRNERIAKLKI